MTFTNDLLHQDYFNKLVRFCKLRIFGAKIQNICFLGHYSEIRGKKLKKCRGPRDKRSHGKLMLRPIYPPSDETEPLQPKLSFADLQYTFSFLLIGYALSLLAFIGEMISNLR